MNKKNVDIFDDIVPKNHRWDIHKNAKLLNIVFHGGTFGNFLKFFIDKFSKLTPNIDLKPFTDIGTSHTMKKNQFSGLIQRYHAQFINDNEGEHNLPVCLILPDSEKDFFYLILAQWYRAGDKKIIPDNLWQKSIDENQNNSFKNVIKQIIGLYPIDLEKNFIPKFIVRDYHKLLFLEDIKGTHNFIWFEIFKNHQFFSKQKTHHLPLASFFNFDTFIKNLKELDSFFNLQLDFENLKEMKSIFDEPYKKDICREQTDLVFKVIQNLQTEENLTIPHLDVAGEAFLYAYIEKTYPFVVAPLTNYFFRDTDEIRSFVKSYPEHYKAMNPNLPKWQGRDNPFYLWKIKNKG